MPTMPLRHTRHRYAASAAAGLHILLIAAAATPMLDTPRAIMRFTTPLPALIVLFCL